MTTLHGVVTFHSETGTEGGYWAFQDERFIGLPSEDRFCKKCGSLESPKANGAIRAEAVYPSEYFDWMDPEWKAPEPCGARTPPEEHELVQISTHPRWSYEGLHIPHTGDHLTIYDKADPTKVVWDGEIDLVDVGVFKEDAGGLWIHNYQRGIDRMTWAQWFFDENTAAYTPKED